MTLNENNLNLKTMNEISFSPDHYPVLYKEVLDSLSVFNLDQELHYMDGTFGRGGHFSILNSHYPKLISDVFDQDIEAIKFANEKYKTLVESGKLKIHHTNFYKFNEYIDKKFDIILLDLGVSSPQLDQAQRGFSFYHDGPLDMRMNQAEGLTAEQVVNTFSEDELISLFQKFGEVYKPFRVVRAIVHDRKTKAFQSTKELAGLIERVDGWRQKGHHPATQYFMGLRLFVNSELDVIEKAIPEMIQALNMGGRLAVISFHSLEDRIVKNIFRNSPTWGVPVNKKVIVPTQDECDRNSRSRSAKLRVFERKVQDEQRKYRKY